MNRFGISLVEEIDADQLAVMGLLNPFARRIPAIFEAAIDQYNTEVSALARAENDDRAAASAIYCYAWAGFQREFMEEPGCHFLKVRGLQVLNVRDQLVIRAKKVDANGRHSNNDTAQQRAFDAQEDLPDLPPAAHRIVIGYQPDIALSMVERVIVRRPLGRWTSQLVNTEEQSWIDITPIELPFSARRAAVG